MALASVAAPGSPEFESADSHQLQVSIAGYRRCKLAQQTKQQQQQQQQQESSTPVEDAITTRRESSNIFAGQRQADTHKLHTRLKPLVPITDSLLNSDTRSNNAQLKRTQSSPVKHPNEAESKLLQRAASIPQSTAHIDAKATAPLRQESAATCVLDLTQLATTQCGVELFVDREPTNPVDTEAIAVWLLHHTSDKRSQSPSPASIQRAASASTSAHHASSRDSHSDRILVGHLSARLASRLSPLLDLHKPPIALQLRVNPIEADKFQFNDTIHAATSATEIKGHQSEPQISNSGAGLKSESDSPIQADCKTSNQVDGQSQSDRSPAASSTVQFNSLDQCDTLRCTLTINRTDVKRAALTEPMQGRLDSLIEWIQTAAHLECDMEPSMQQLHNFKIIHQTVMERNQHLFTKDELSDLNQLLSCTAESQRFLIRLLHRQQHRLKDCTSRPKWFELQPLIDAAKAYETDGQQTERQSVQDCVADLSRTAPRNKNSTRKSESASQLDIHTVVKSEPESRDCSPVAALLLRSDSPSVSASQFYDEVLDHLRLPQLQACAQKLGLAKRFGAKTKTAYADQLRSAMSSQRTLSGQRLIDCPRVRQTVQQLIGVHISLTSRLLSVCQRLYRLFFLNIQDLTTSDAMEVASMQTREQLDLIRFYQHPKQSAGESNQASATQLSLFPSRDCFLAFDSALHLLQHMRIALEPQWDSVKQQKRTAANQSMRMDTELGVQLQREITSRLLEANADSASAKFGLGPITCDSLLSDDELTDSELQSFVPHSASAAAPASDSASPFMLRYRASSVLAQACTYGCRILDKLKRHAASTRLLLYLLTLPHCPERRGAWWIRAILNLTQHLSHHAHAYRFVQFALADSHVRTGDRVDIERRCVRLWRWHEDHSEEDEIKPCPVLTFVAPPLATLSSAKRRDRSQVKRQQKQSVKRQRLSISSKSKAQRCSDSSDDSDVFVSENADKDATNVNRPSAIRSPSSDSCSDCTVTQHVRSTSSSLASSASKTPAKGAAASTNQKSKRLKANANSTNASSQKSAKTNKAQTVRSAHSLDQDDDDEIWRDDDALIRTDSLIMRVGDVSPSARTSDANSAAAGQITVVTILARPVNSEVGQKSIFFDEHNNECTVEQLAMQWYAQEEHGSFEGVHCENSLFASLFALLMFDCIFASSQQGVSPIVWQSPYQDAPLDLHTDQFFESRRVMIEERLASIQTGSAFASAQLALVWHTHHLTRCRGLNWQAFTLSQLQLIAEAMGGHALAQVCRLFATDYANAAGGLPDLCLYKSLANRTDPNLYATNAPSTAATPIKPSQAIDLRWETDKEEPESMRDEPLDSDCIEIQKDTPQVEDKQSLSDAAHSAQLSAHNVILCEVKGPRDRLSPQQMNWLQALSHLIPVHVLHVREPKFA